MNRIGGLLAGALLIVPGSATSPISPEESAGNLVALVDNVAPREPHGNDLRAGTSGGAGSARAFDPTSLNVELPERADEGVRIAAHGSGGPDWTIGLPEEAHGADRIAVDRNSVYEGGRGTDLVVKTTETDVTIMTVSHQPAQRLTYEYEFPEDARFVANADGSVTVSRGRATDSGAHVFPAWARDAEGDSVATHYHLEGNILTQVIEPDSSTEFPVVADPRISLGFGVYLSAWSWEWASLFGALTAVSTAPVIAGCVINNRLPSGWAAALRAACGTVGASNLNNFLRWIEGTMAATIRNLGYGCYQINLARNWQRLTRVADAQCRP